MWRVLPFGLRFRFPIDTHPLLCLDRPEGYYGVVLFEIIRVKISPYNRNDR